MDSSLDNGDTSFVDNGETSFETTELSDQVDINQICRLCANAAELTIPIFEEEGLEHDLKTKIAQYLPIKVKETDKLPTKLCYQCASTIVAWHDLFDGCFEAEKKLKDLIGDDSPCSYEEETYGTVENSLTDFIKIKPKGDTLPSRSKSVRLEPIEKDKNFQFTLNVPHCDENSKFFCLICGSPMTSLHSFKSHIFLNHSVNSNVLNWAKPSSSSSSVAKKEKPEYLMYTLDMTETALNRLCFCVLCGSIKINVHSLISHLNQEHKIYAHVNLEEDAVTLQNAKCSPSRSEESSGSSEVVKGSESYSKEDEKTSSSEFDYWSLGLGKRCKKKCGGETGTLHGQVSHLELLGSKNDRPEPKQKDQIKVIKLGIKTRPSRSQRIKQYRERLRFREGVVNDQDQSECVRLPHTKPDIDKEPTVAAQPVKRKLSWRDQLRERMGTFNLPPAQYYSCSLCKKGGVFKRKISLLAHIYKRHRGRKMPRANVYNSDQFDPKYASFEPHTGRIRCKVCSKLLSKASFIRHQRTHSGERPYPCQLCDKRFCMPNDVVKHVKSVHERNPLQCKNCQEVFESRRDLLAHRRTTHFTDVSIVCELCGKVFHNQSTYLYHTMAHRINESKHYCETCDRRFLTRQRLKNHMRGHTGETPFQCSECGRCFAHMATLQTHVRNVHRREKEHHCPICGRGFFRRYYVAKHIRNVHHPLAPDDERDCDPLFDPRR